MSLIETVTDTSGITWGVYKDESDGTMFYVRSE
jgi:hypothetical protein